MAWQSSPTASHRYQWKVVAIGASPLKSPMFAVSWRFGSATPPIDGVVVTDGEKCGLSMIGNVWFVITKSEPPALVPKIHTRSDRPMSATVGVYVDDVAPMIGMQVGMSPAGLQRRHEYVKTMGVDPSHVPVATDSGVS